MRRLNVEVRIVAPSRNLPRLSRYTMPTRQLIDWSYTAQQRNPVIAIPKFVAIARSTVAGTNPGGVSVGDCWLAKSSRLLDISVHLAKWMDCSISLLTHVPTLLQNYRYHSLARPLIYPSIALEIGGVYNGKPRPSKHRGSFNTSLHQHLVAKPHLHAPSRPMTSSRLADRCERFATNSL